MYSIIKQAKKERKQKSKKILIPHLKEGVLYFLDCFLYDKNITEFFFIPNFTPQQQCWLSMIFLLDKQK